MQATGLKLELLTSIVLVCVTMCRPHSDIERMQRIVGDNHASIYHQKLLLLQKPSYDSMSESMIHFLCEGIPAEEMNRVHKFRQTAQREKHPVSEFWL